MARASTNRRIHLENLGDLSRTLRPIVAKNKARAERLIAELEEFRARMPEDFYRHGLALAELSRPALYAAAGHKNFRELLRARRLVGASTAYKLIAVVHNYPRAQAEGLGFAVAYALTRFVAATPEDDRASRLVAGNVMIGRTPVDRITVRQLNAATERVRRAAAKPTKDPEAKAARRAGRELQKRLRAAGAGSAKVKAVRLEGEWCLRTDMVVGDAGGWG
ncbi:MAG: hypothetical protein DRJ42_28850 [Deltaproteobacteria bacterium]|nr:MAG: hypothetical protein DRJ42_28850 [Deltaproteobacteria bacterium]